MSESSGRGIGSVDDSLQAFLDSRLSSHGVVGASLAILKSGQIQQAASGLLNVGTKVEVTPESTFQIGSVGKVFTATLICQLVDEGLVDLDAPVRRYLPSFQIASHEVAERLTVRQLLTHTSGMQGDFFPKDEIWGVAAADYLQKMTLLPQLHEPDQFMSYCNSGYVLAGHLIEVMRRMPWHKAVMDFICHPLGLKNAYADPSEAIRFRSALGHISPGSGKAIVPSPVSYLPKSIAAAGSVLTMSATDLLRFADMHMNSGMSSTGTKVLSTEMAAHMQKAQVALLPHSRVGFNQMGLSWFIGEHADVRVVGHDGATAGQWAYMQCLPQRQLAYALLTNSPSAALSEEVRRYFFEKVAGVPVPPEPAPVSSADDLDLYPGVYENIATSVEIGRSAAGLFMSVRPKRGDSGKLLEVALSPYSPSCFQIESKDPSLKGRVGFAGIANGRAQFVRLGVRLARRVH